jgi:HPt (histidine-containing phosphotransfer) domain-containing protein
MRTAAQAGDWPRVSAGAHALKGSASNLGAKRLSALCGILEKEGKSNDGTQALASLAEVESEFGKVELTLRQELER